MQSNSKWGEIMKKRYLFSAIGLGAGVLTTIVLRNMFRKEGAVISTLEKAGVPDQVGENELAQLENAKMVSEGSSYGVHYYNMLQEENTH